MPTNLELKARSENDAELLRSLRRLGAKNTGVVKQTDTYFRFHHGRLKLREMDNSRSELIWYRRPNRQEHRFSDFKRVSVRDPQALRRILAASIGVKAVVKKRRRVYMFRNARIHVDDVEKLGTFIEFEVMVTKGRGQAQQLLSFLRKSLQIRSRSILVSSYCDLLNRPRKKTR